MIEKKYIPEFYIVFDKAGYTNYKSQQYLWLNDMEWMTVESIVHYEYSEGEKKNIIPFAVNGGGDKWAIIYDHRMENWKVGFCPHDDFDGTYYANNFEDAIFRQIVEFVADNNFYSNQIEKESFQYSLDELRHFLSIWKKKLVGFLSQDKLDYIDFLLNLELKEVSSKYGKWVCLLSDDELKNVLKKIYFQEMDQYFRWQY